MNGDAPAGTALAAVPTLSGIDPRKGRERGFTLVELTVTMVVAVILITALVRFYKDTYRTYSIQEEIADRNQNANYTLSKMVEVLQQAGSLLPDTASGWKVITIAGGNVRIGINPRGAMQFNGTAAGSSYFIPVGDATLFANTSNVLLNTTHVLIDYVAPGVAVLKDSIDQGYNTGGFVNGVKDNATGMDSIRVITAVALAIGDKVYGYREDVYALSGSDLVIRPSGNISAQMVLAENIDSLGITFLTNAGVTTTAWKTMRSAKITVRARTERPDPKLPAPGYRKITLPMNIILRNKV